MTKWKSNDFLYVKLRTRLDTIILKLISTANEVEIIIEVKKNRK